MIRSLKKTVNIVANNHVQELKNFSEENAKKTGASVIGMNIGLDMLKTFVETKLKEIQNEEKKNETNHD